jgi:hypothetical protein
MNPRLARVIAWSLVFVFITLATAGLSLQLITNTSYTNIGIPVLLLMIVLVGIWPVIGAKIVTRFPRHAVGWLLIFGVFFASFDMFAQGYVSFSTAAPSGSLPGVGLALIWLNWSGFPFSTAAFALMILLFPTGRPPTLGWHIIGWTAVAALLLYLPLQALRPGPVDPPSGIFLLNPLGVSASLWTYLDPLRRIVLSILVLCYTAAFISLVYRLRRASGDKRQQIKWLVVPAGLYWVSLPFIFISLTENNVTILGIGVALGIPAIAGMVIATAFAILKYHLYHIDFIINRTLVYGSLTAVLAGIYLGVVVLIQALFTAVSRQQSPLAIVISTLIIAALFKPLRNRVQEFVDRRFYRRKYDASLVLAQFAITARDEVNLEVLSDSLLQTIEETLKPEFCILWLRGEAQRWIGRTDERERQ